MLEESWKLFTNIICCSSQIHPLPLGAGAFSEKVLVTVCACDLHIGYIAEVRAWKFGQIKTFIPSVVEDMTPRDLYGFFELVISC
jgi:hypothetical protein